MRLLVSLVKIDNQSGIPRLINSLADTWARIHPKTSIMHHF